MHLAPPCLSELIKEESPPQEVLLQPVGVLPTEPDSKSPLGTVAATNEPAQAQTLRKHNVMVLLNLILSHAFKITLKNFLIAWFIVAD
jgi:hypothetical protein